MLQIIRDSSEITPCSDAVIVPLVLNSYQVSCAIGIAIESMHILRRLAVPAIPVGYVSTGKGSTASFVTKSPPIPENKAKIVGHIAVATEAIGLKALYLDAGSGYD
jgi:heptaprenylglyceryl phosphate synthase